MIETNYYDNHIEVKLQVKSALPSQLEIRERFRAKFPHLAYSLDPILNPVSEEAERLLGELFRTGETASVTIRSADGKSKSKTNNFIRMTGYACPRCRSMEVRYGFNHCPGCGTKIEWK